MLIDQGRILEEIDVFNARLIMLALSVIHGITVSCAPPQVRH